MDRGGCRLRVEVVGGYGGTVCVLDAKSNQSCSSQRQALYPAKWEDVARNANTGLGMRKGRRFDTSQAAYRYLATILTLLPEI